MDTAIGELVLIFNEQALISLSIENISTTHENEVTDAVTISSTEKGQKAVLSQLKHYFSAAKPFNDIALLPAGTAFQKSVWLELTKIPLGETRTYGQIAINLNTSARAVGNACRRNPIQIIIPCHRVVSATGIGGYAGDTAGDQLSIKRWLLHHEGVQV
jgi:methylated-DNA-[protein]-cysteine S-methyltransferase